MKSFRDVKQVLVVHFHQQMTLEDDLFGTRRVEIGKRTERAPLMNAYLMHSSMLHWMLAYVVSEIETRWKSPSR